MPPSLWSSPASPPRPCSCSYSSVSSSHEGEGDRHGKLVRWPGPDPLTDEPEGSLVVAASTPRPGVAVLRAVGEIDLLTAPGWRRLLTAAGRVLRLDPPPAPQLSPSPDHRPGEGARCLPAVPPIAPRLVCDLSPVSFLGASGLDVLVELAEHCSQAEIDLRVVADSSAVLRPLRITGLDQRLVVHDSLEGAVQATAASAAFR